MTSIPQFARKSGTVAGGRRRSARRGAAATTTPATGNREKWVLPLAVLAALVIVLAGWMLLVSPVRSDTQVVTAQAALVDQQVATLRSQVAGLQRDQANLPRYRAELNASQAALPTTAALPAFLRTLQNLGVSTGTTVTVLDATAPDGSASGTTTGSGAVGTVYRVPITVTVRGSYDGLTAFVKVLQAEQPRAVLIDTINEKAATAGTATINLTMTAFVAPTAGATRNGG